MTIGNQIDRTQMMMDTSRDATKTATIVDIKAECEPSHSAQKTPDTTMTPNASDVEIKCESNPPIQSPDTTVVKSESHHQIPEPSTSAVVRQPEFQQVPVFRDPHPFVVCVRRDEVVRTIVVPVEREVVDFAANRLQNDNRGFQMLQRNGWVPGETIGLNGTGIGEPIV